MKLSFSSEHRSLRKSECGYTLIEIIAALAVFMIGVMGMTALQSVSISAAAKSRNQTAAVSIARFITAQLKTEFASWDRDKENTAEFPDNYPLLKTIFAEDSSAGTWIQYGEGTEGEVGDFRVDEFLGHSALESNTGPSKFCINYRVDSLENLGEVEPSQYSVWQIRVRVSWTNEGAYAADWDKCDPTNVERRILTDASDTVVELTSIATREMAR